MNWLAFDVRAYAAALAGCAVAVVLAACVPPLAESSPWLAGLLAGIACAAAARDRSGPRGLVVAVMATWTAAFESAARSELGFGPALLELHATLAPLDLAAYGLGFVCAVTFGRTSLRRGAGERPAGA